MYCIKRWAIIKSNLAVHVDDDDEDEDDDVDNNVSATDNPHETEGRTTEDHQMNEDNISRSQIDGARPSRTNSKKSSSLKRNQYLLGAGSTTGSQKTVDERLARDRQKVDEGQTSDTRATDDEQHPTVSKDELDDPLPGKLKGTVNARLKNDFLVCIVIGVLVFSLHSSTVFTVLQPELNPILQTFAIVLGFLLHYVLPQMRKYLPWLCFAKPIFKQKEYGLYETSEAAKIMWFENVFVCLTFFERNVLLPLVYISALTSESATIVHKFGVPIGTVIVVLCGIKSTRPSPLLRSSAFKY